MSFADSLFLFIPTNQSSSFALHFEDSNFYKCQVQVKTMEKRLYIYEIYGFVGHSFLFGGGGECFCYALNTFIGLR